MSKADERVLLELRQSTCRLGESDEAAKKLLPKAVEYEEQGTCIFLLQISGKEPIEYGARKAELTVLG